VCLSGYLYGGRAKVWVRAERPHLARSRRGRMVTLPILFTPWHVQQRDTSSYKT
jgi:hypothetical protein